MWPQSLWIRLLGVIFHYYTGRKTFYLHLFLFIIKNKTILDSLLRGYEAELPDGAKGDVSLRMLNLFSEVKRIQNELPIDEEPQNNQVVCILHKLY